MKPRLSAFLMHKNSDKGTSDDSNAASSCLKLLQRNKQLPTIPKSLARSGIFSSDPPHFWLSFSTGALTIITPVVTPVIMPALAASFAFSIFATLTTPFASSFAAVFATSLHCKDTNANSKSGNLGMEWWIRQSCHWLTTTRYPMAVWLTSLVQAT